MKHRHPRLCPPRLWMFTDPRGGDPVAAIEQLPRGSGVVFRHYHLPPRQRRALFGRVRQAVRRRRGVLLLAGPPKLAAAWGADGAYDRSARRSQGVRAVGVHNDAEAALARRVRADFVFVSPVFPTRSHAGARTLGPVRLGLLLRHIDAAAYALGGMDARRWRRLKALKLAGYGAIDALHPLVRT